MRRRRLLAACLLAAVLMGLSGCYERVVRDDRFGSDAEVYEPNRQRDVIDDAEDALREPKPRPWQQQQPRHQPTQRSGGG